MNLIIHNLVQIEERRNGAPLYQVPEIIRPTNEIIRYRFIGNTAG